MEIIVMEGKKTFLKGIHYRNAFIYNLLTGLKLGYNYNLRYKIATGHIERGDSILDICGGTGTLKNFLPENCAYTCIEASPEFISILARNNLKNLRIDLHNGINGKDLKADVIVMIISLCHFRNTSMHDLLEAFKKIANRVVIVEDVLSKKRRRDSLLQRTMNYLCQVPYYLPVELFTFEEFKQVMGMHNYKCIKYSLRYSVGYYSA